MVNHCKFWLPKTNRFCANNPLTNSLFSGNHTPRINDQWIPCPVDPSNYVRQENLKGHLKRCSLLEQVQSLSTQPFYQKAVNAGKEGERKEKETLIPPSASFDNVPFEMKRNDGYSLNIHEFFELIRKIESVHAQIWKDNKDAYKIPEACGRWIKREIDRKLSFQEKACYTAGVNSWKMDDFGVLESSVGKKQYKFVELAENSNGVPTVVDFEITISREACYTAGVISWELGRVWSFGKFCLQGIVDIFGSS